MNDIREKIKQGYDNTELPEELRLKVRREFLTAAEAKTEGGITMSRKIKKPAAIGLIAAAALTISVTAGAAASGIFHRESIDTHLGEGAADEVTSTVNFGSYWVENDYMRVTADAVFCDGNSATIFLTVESLTDPSLGWYQLTADNGDTFMERLLWFDATYEDGSFAGNGSDCGTRNIEPPADGVDYMRCEIRNIEPGRPIVLTAYDDHEFREMFDSLSDEEREELFAREDYDEYREELYHPEHVQGISLTIDTTPNFTPVTYADKAGRELYLTPYRAYTYATYEGKETLEVIYEYKFTLKNSETGETLDVELEGGSGHIPDENGVTYTSFSFIDYISDMDKYDIIITGNYGVEDTGTFYRQ